MGGNGGWFYGRPFRDSPQKVRITVTIGESSPLEVAGIDALQYLLRGISVYWGGSLFNSQVGQVWFSTSMDQYDIHQIGGKGITEWRIPAEDLEEFNNNIVGEIEVIREFRKEDGN